MKKNKLLTKLLAMTIAISAAFAFIACTPTKVPDTEQTLEVYVINKGLGYKWCEDLLALFQEQDWVKAKYPNLEIVFTQNDSWGYASGKLASGEKHNTIDLMFGLGMADYFGDAGYLVDLTECVYNAEIPDGSGIKVGEKMRPGLKESFRYCDPTNLDRETYFSTPWAGGLDGIVYNVSLLERYGIEVPNTTDELEAACSKIKAENPDSLPESQRKYCFFQSAKAAYFNYLFETWWAQYEGLDEYLNYWNGLSGNAYSSAIFDQQGRLKALEVFEDLLDSDKGYVDPRSFRFSTMETQRAFFQGASAFHVNGTYVAVETKNKETEAVTDSFSMMKTPIISALGEKLGITDENLSEIVDYVDGKTTVEPTFESTTEYLKEEVIDIVKEARSFIHEDGQDAHSVIPKYAKGKDIAIDFLLFMATDKAIESYAISTGGCTLPYDYNFKAKNEELYNSFGDVQRGTIDILIPTIEGVEPGYLLPSPKYFPLVRYGKLSAFVDALYYQTFSSATNKKTPADYMKEMKDSWNEEKFQNALVKAGLSK